ncbi:tRNA epoxyqueuosine(34) reductase QueG [Enterococcus saccharolyticus]|uniref:Iron-sulfur cluster-binding protein n=1 Tax=Enterococcus saccharolyticus subsp. saccharolyticus ATCC 43076 TaxID=1139996 RepID=S0NWU2_9ENTE|nr:tRNA epoxyqueuosine(34) reductase QueG [Enterococcus saccharolyticus]EOT29164.1 iron-sulfur cluster-binding protein [Enterococcus saccharolyticus subsp. saccharolyticus ATCC 43076]EOT80963.1 iron-sulfur cluster-binding protein [Enterococcus saccharolyticus subsp. saccharolyticus ATCC 43076]OJG89580.1 iron-sulfur cluster-binding protein [Enterococcus saccharolyticus]
MLTLKEKIIAESKKIGIDKIGFTTAEPFDYLKDSLIEQREAGHTSGFEHQVIDERIYPEKTFENPKSIIAIALAYPTRIHEEVPRDEKRGQFARASWGIDYHNILKDRLERLIDFIQTEATSEQEAEQWRFAPQVDTGELVDVAVAQRAGLGFIGKNGLLITEEYGSFVYLGEIITNIQFEPDKPVPNGCGDCTRCITGCPTGALLGDGRMNAKKCLSYQTQTKGMMPKEYRRKIRNTIYGCDICQLVCPYNKGKDFHFHQEMEPKPDEVFPKLVPMLSISNKEFKAQFGHLAGSWRGKKPLQRNALIALANLGGREALPDIAKCLDDQRPVIRGTAVWAIGQLTKRNPEQYLERLQAMQEKETDEDVLLELEETITFLTDPTKKKA